MAHIPQVVAETKLSLTLQQAGLVRIYQGKVRDTYAVPDHPELLLQVASDRLSIFDFVLPTLVKDKGAILTAMTVFWLTKVCVGINHHLIACGWDLDHYLPSNLWDNSQLHKNALIVKKLRIVPVECIVRGYLTGSGWQDYQKSGQICGIALPQGLHDGSKLPVPIFTPTTKAESGHDQALKRDDVVNQYGAWLLLDSLQIYQAAAEYALKRGIIIADTKFEFGQHAVADEVLTPDSSRFWLEEDWQRAAAEKRAPQGFDKQPVREWGKTIETSFGVTGLNKLETENPEHLAFIAALQVPETVSDACSRRYHRIFELLTGDSLAYFQQEFMGIK